LRAHFSRCSRRVVVVLLWAVFLKNHASLHAQQEAESRNKLALIGARIYPAPDAKPILNGIVIVANGQIVRVGERDSRILPKGIRTIGCTGKTLVAGLWNTHVHFIESKWNHARSLPAGQLTAQLQDMLTGWFHVSCRHRFTPAKYVSSTTQNNEWRGSRTWNSDRWNDPLSRGRPPLLRNRVLVA
jgi:predicted amidohydrolase YtcJ